MKLKPISVKYVGFTLGDAPIAAITITKYPGHVGDLPADFAKLPDFDAKTNPSFKAHTQIGVGLLGFKFPSTPKSPSSTKYYGLTIADAPLAAIVVDQHPRTVGDLDADFSNPDLRLEAVKGTPAHKTVAIGLLGFIRIPLGK